MSTDVAQLRSLLVGADIVAVDTPDLGVREAFCKITTRKDGSLHVFHLHATDLGFWIGEHTTSKSGGDTFYESFQQLLDSVSDHASDLFHKKWEDAGRPESEEDPYWKDSPYPDIVAISDPKAPCIGFKCRTTGKVWKARLNAVKQYEQETGISYRTTDVRQRAAALLAEGFVPSRGHLEEPVG